MLWKSNIGLKYTPFLPTNSLCPMESAHRFISSPIGSWENRPWRPGDKHRALHGTKDGGVHLPLVPEQCSVLQFLCTPRFLAQLSHKGRGTKCLKTPACSSPPEVTAPWRAPRLCQRLPIFMEYIMSFLSTKMLLSIWDCECLRGNPWLTMRPGPGALT
jgi:hypothetical protein